jgi:hypothetical protein
VRKLSKEEIDRRTSIVIEQFDGINPPFEAFYIRSILYSAEQCSSSYDSFSAALKEHKPASIAFAGIQEAITHAASVARFFWPVAKSSLYVTRAKRLRNACKVKDDSPLNDRHLRNSLEHFDERLDNFLLENDAGYFFPEPMLGDFRVAKEKVGKIFKLVDPECAVVVILNEAFDYGPIIDEVDRIAAELRGMVTTGRLPRYETATD